MTMLSLSSQGKTLKYRHGIELQRVSFKKVEKSRYQVRKYGIPKSTSIPLMLNLLK